MLSPPAQVSASAVVVVRLELHVVAIPIDAAITDVGGVEEAGESGRDEEDLVGTHGDEVVVALR